MDFLDSFHAYKDAVISFTGLSDKVLHINIGLAIFLLAQLCFRDRRASVLALKVLISCELANEFLDRLYSGSWRWSDSTTDILATLFWPTAIVLVGKYRRARWQRRIAVAELLSLPRERARASSI